MLVPDVILLVVAGAGMAVGGEGLRVVAGFEPRRAWPRSAGSEGGQWVVARCVTLCCHASSLVALGLDVGSNLVTCPCGGVGALLISQWAFGRCWLSGVGYLGRCMLGVMKHAQI
jgi:hypothetical protein